MDGDEHWPTGLLLPVPRLANKLLLRHIDGDETFNLDAPGESIPRGLEACLGTVSETRGARRQKRRNQHSEHAR